MPVHSKTESEYRKPMTQKTSTIAAKRTYNQATQFPPFRKYTSISIAELTFEIEIAQEVLDPRPSLIKIRAYASDSDAFITSRHSQVHLQRDDD